MYYGVFLLLKIYRNVSFCFRTLLEMRHICVSESNMQMYESFIGIGMALGNITL